MDMTEFYPIETPPSSSSTSKDSNEEFLLSIQSRKKLKLSPTSMESNSNNICSTSKSTLTINPVIIKSNEFDSSLYDDMHTPLRRTLGNTKLKTRQDVRRFRKFLKRHHDVSSMALIDIDPDTMRTYLIDYLTSIRTRKGLKYDPETLRSYYLSIQRFLKDSNYPYCLRNSPQFAQCRDLIIQMRKEKNQNKSTDLALKATIDMKKTRFILNKKSALQPTSVNGNTEKQQQQQVRSDHQASSSEILIPILSTKDLLPSSSLPPRKRQQMKYFLEFGSPNDFILLPKPFSSSSKSPSLSILSSDAYLLLLQLTHLSSSSHRYTHSIEQLLDQSPVCGNLQRLMLTRLCQEWTGDIRLIHSNLRFELRSLLPHILVLNILSSIRKSPLM